LPDDIAVKEAHRVADSFSVRRHAISREYSYHILNSSVRSPLAKRLAYRVAGSLDAAAMNKACQVLIGQHDFASFASGIGGQVRSTVRRVHHAQVERSGEWIVFSISAGSFLPHQVRNTIGVLIRIGQGKMSIDQFGDLMAVRKPGLAGPTAPACGLYLMRVDYPCPLEEEL
jgi:tRNA pseudouridine38-40 synthase